RHVEVEAIASETRLRAEADAEATTVLEKARVDAERDRMEIYRQLPAAALLGLAARELAGKLHSIEHLNVTPDLLGPLFTRVLRAGAERLEEEV
ncbi:band 7 protein, partial [Planctomycetota bacterium]